MLAFVVSKWAGEGVTCNRASSIPIFPVACVTFVAFIDMHPYHSPMLYMISKSVLNKNNSRLHNDLLR